MEVVAGCRYQCDPTGDRTTCAPVCTVREGRARIRRTRVHVPAIDLPLGATEDRVVGALDLERALTQGQKAFEPGLLARAHRGFLYIDEVNLLEDHLVDLLLDVAASGENVVGREGLSVRHPTDRTKAPGPGGRHGAGRDRRARRRRGRGRRATSATRGTRVPEARCRNSRPDRRPRPSAGPVGSSTDPCGRCDGSPKVAAACVEGDLVARQDRRVQPDPAANARGQGHRHLVDLDRQRAPVPGQGAWPHGEAVGRDVERPAAALGHGPAMPSPAVEGDVECAVLPRSPLPRRRAQA